MKISLIIPTLNESGVIGGLLSRLQAFRQQGHELIIVDGGSEDNTASLAAGGCDRLLICAAGRARQMNLGADQASGEVLLFLHADTIIDENAIRELVAACSEPGLVWGRFDVRLSGHAAIFRLIAAAMNLRSRLTGIATGDQGIFVRRCRFIEVGGYPDQPLMEDVELSRTLRKLGRPCCLASRLLVSSRRWERHGVVGTILLMWWLRLAYYFGASPSSLASIYYNKSL